jgi:EipB-like
MKPILSLPLIALLAVIGPVRAEVSVPLASHRAAYEISLTDTDTSRPPSGATPVAASGLIAYEFRGASCEGYASNFHQLTELQRNEGDPISSDLRALTFEDPDGKNLRFQIDSQNSGSNDPPVAGDAARSDGGATTVELIKPTKEKLDIGRDILFPTQHVEHIIAKAKEGGGTLEARVYDGSDTGKKVFDTLTVIGKQETSPGPDAAAAQGLEKVRRWPVSVSYFDEAAKDAPPEYVLSFDLYENGVSGTLKLDYGAFALTAKLAKLEWLPTPACATK